MDMRHSEYRAIRREFNSRQLRRLKREMRSAERTFSVALLPREALRAAQTLRMARQLYGNGEVGHMYVATFGVANGERVGELMDIAVMGRAS